MIWGMTYRILSQISPKNLMCRFFSLQVPLCMKYWLTCQVKQFLVANKYYIFICLPVFEADMLNCVFVLSILSFPVNFWLLVLFRSTPKSRPNKVGLRCLSVRTSIRPSTKSFSDSDEIWYVGRGRWVMHDGMPHDPIQGKVPLQRSRIVSL